MFEKDSSGKRDRTASLAWISSSKSLGTMWDTLSVSPSDTTSNPSGEALSAMWSLMLSDARIACLSSSVRTTTFAGKLRLGTFGSLVPEGRNDVDDLPENIGFDLPLEQTTLPQNFGGKSGGLL